MKRETSKQRVRAFSLVEVTLALGIVAFGLVVMLGLLPTGLNLVRESSDESVGINILTALVSDLRNSGSGTASTAVYNIPLGAVGSGTLYFDEAGKLLGTASSPAAIYKAAWSVRARDVSQGIYPNAHLRVGWPAVAATPLGSVEAVVILNADPAP